MSILADHAPAALWKHFEALSRIPRVSRNERAAGDYVQGIATARGLKSFRDAAGNVLVRKPASPGCEDRAAVILQSHLDMVGQKTAASTHDFARDPLKLRIDGGWLTAEGTTLGADNGIGAAAALAILESTDVRHGPLSALFTVEEEIGLHGAAAVTPAMLDGDLLVNLDSDMPGELTIGCAGALTIRAEFSAGRDPVPVLWRGLRVRLHGLQGGHSGADIHRGRANALRTLARMLAETASAVPLRLCSFLGGDARNAIPREATALVALPAGECSSATSTLWALVDAIRSEFQDTEPGLAVSIEECPAPAQGLPADASLRLLAFLRAGPIGVIRTLAGQDGAVETSNNLAIVEFGETGPAVAQYLARSVVESAKWDVFGTLGGLALLAGGKIEAQGNYPGWKPAQHSRLVPVLAAACERVLGHPARTSVVHGGLECGILMAAKPSLDCVSIGPRIESMHSPDERVEISSVEAFYRILTSALETLPKAD